MLEERELMEGDLDQIIASLMRKIDQGEKIDAQQLVMDHPHLQAELEAYLADVALIEKLAGPTASEQCYASEWNVKAEQTVHYRQGGHSESGTESQLLQGRFGRYQIEKVLGQGAMGTVYLAEDLELERQVALKVPRLDDSESAEMVLERFYREARSAATLRHRGICPVYDVGCEEGVSYISMAFIPGMPLATCIAQGKINSQRKIGIVMRKLALALEAAHQQGVIHRDLKPANIMLDEDNEPVIMDFGLARQLGKQEAERLTVTGMVMGSPAYMSPEQVTGDIDAVGPQSDIYNLGVILYELLTGRLPFQGPAVVLIGKILTAEPVPPSRQVEGVTPELEAICLKMLAKKIDDRYQSMQQVVDALTAFLKQSGQNSTAPSRGESSSTPEQQMTPRWYDFRNGSVSGRAVFLAAALPVVFLLGAIILLIRAGERTVQVTIDDPSAVVIIDGKQRVRFSGKQGEVELAIGSHEVTVTHNGTIVKGYDQFHFVVAENGNEPLVIEVLDQTAPPVEKPVAKPASESPPLDEPDPVLARLLAMMRQKPVMVQEFDFNRGPDKIGVSNVTFRNGRMLIEMNSGFHDGAWPWADGNGSGLIQVDVKLLEGAGWLVNLHTSEDIGFLIELKDGEMAARASLFGDRKNTLMPGYKLLEKEAPSRGLNQIDQLLILIEGRKITVFLNGKQCGEPFTLDFDIGNYSVLVGALNNNRDQMTKVEYERIRIFPLLPTPHTETEAATP